MRNKNLRKWSCCYDPDLGRNIYRLRHGRHTAMVQNLPRTGWEASVIINGAGGWTFSYATTKRHAMLTVRRLFAQLKKESTDAK